MMPTCSEHPSGPEVTCHLCHVAKLVDGAVEEGRIEVASAVVADVYEAEVKAVLDALGLEWALVTDGSQVGHFDNLDLGGETPEGRLSRALGIDVLASDYVIDVAKQLRAKKGE